MGETGFLGACHSHLRDPTLAQRFYELSHQVGPSELDTDCMKYVNDSDVYLAGVRLAAFVIDNKRIYPCFAWWDW